MGKEPAAKPFYSVLVLAFVCSLLVSTAAVKSRLIQERNRELDRQKNILRAAQMYDADTPVDTLFGTIETRIIELSTGEFVSESELSPIKERCLTTRSTMNASPSFVSSTRRGALGTFLKN